MQAVKPVEEAGSDRNYLMTGEREALTYQNPCSLTAGYLVKQAESGNETRLQPFRQNTG